MWNVRSKSLLPFLAITSTLFYACGGAPSAVPAPTPVPTPPPGTQQTALCTANTATVYYSAYQQQTLGANGCPNAPGTVPLGPQALQGEWKSPEQADPQGHFTFHYVLQIYATSQPAMIKFGKEFTIVNKLFKATPAPLVSGNVAITTITGTTVTMNASQSISMPQKMTTWDPTTEQYVYFTSAPLITPTSFTYSLVAPTDPARMNFTLTLPSGAVAVQIYTKTQ